MRYDQDKCLNFLRNDKKKSNAGRIPIYVGHKPTCKEPLREIDQTRRISAATDSLEMDKRRLKDQLPEEKLLASRDKIEHGNVPRLNFSEDKADEFNYTSNDGKLVNAKLEGEKHSLTTHVNNKAKASMIPKSTLRTRKGSKKRAAALVDELSKSVEDLSRTQSTSSNLDSSRLTKASKFSKSCGNLDNNAKLTSEFTQENSERSTEEVPLKTNYDKQDKLLIGTRKDSAKGKDSNTVSKIPTDLKDKRHNNGVTKDPRTTTSDEKSKEKQPVVPDKSSNIDKPVPNSYLAIHTAYNQQRRAAESAIKEATRIKANWNNANNRSPSIPGEQRKTLTDSQLLHDQTNSSTKTGSEELKLGNNELTDQDHRAVAKESDAIIADIKSKNKGGKTREDIPITAKKVDMDTKGQFFPRPPDASVGESRSSYKHGTFLNDKTEQKKNIGGTEMKREKVPMISNAIKMNSSFDKEKLSKSIEDMVALNTALHNHSNGKESHNTHLEKSKDYDKQEDSTNSVNKGRRTLYPKLNLSLNFEDSHQLSPPDSSNGVLELSSGLVAKNNRSNYNFHISLDESQELSHSVNLIKGKIFNSKEEWNATQTNASALRSENDESERKPSAGRLSTINSNRSQAMEIATDKKRQGLDDFAYVDRTDTVHSGDASEFTRNGASSSCSLIYNKEMGLICKKCFASSCYHIDQVRGSEALNAKNIKSEENKPSASLSKPQGSIDTSGTDVVTKHGENMLDYEHRDVTRATNLARNIRSIPNKNTNNVLLADSNNMSDSDYNIHTNSTKRDKIQNGYQTGLNNSGRNKNPIPPSRSNTINYPVEHLEKYNPELCNNNTSSFNAGSENDNYTDYLSNRIQDNRKTLNHLLRTSPVLNVSQDEDGGTSFRSVNELESPKCRRSNSILAASDLETVFEVDERAATPAATDLSTPKSFSTVGSKSAQEFEHTPGEDSNGEHLASPDLPQYDKKDQILQLLDQARSILNLKKRKTSQDCNINTNRIYVKNMMRANSAISNATTSPIKKPKTVETADDIKKSKSAPGSIERRQISDYENRTPNQRVKKPEYDALGHRMDIPLDLWVNVGSNSFGEEQTRDNSATSKKDNFKPSNSFGLNSTQDVKQHRTSQNSTPSPGDSGIEVNNSNSNSYNSTTLDSKRDLTTLSKDETFLSYSELYSRGNVAPIHQRSATYVRDKPTATNVSPLDTRKLHTIDQTRDNRYKNASDNTSGEGVGFRRPYETPVSSSKVSVATLPRKPFSMSSRISSNVRDQPAYTEKGVLIDSDAWSGNRYENSIRSNYKFGDTFHNQNTNDYTTGTSPYSRHYSTTLPTPPTHDRFNTTNKPVRTKSSYRLSNHIISTGNQQENQQENFSDRNLSAGRLRTRRDFIDPSRNKRISL